MHLSGRVASAEDLKMTSKLIFVSRGQLTKEERELGQLIKAEIDAVAGFQAYYADTVQSLSGLADHILDALRRCAGAVVVLHPRGRVVSDQGDEFRVRSSVWVNQEVAILAYRQFLGPSSVPILAFSDETVSLEGAMTAFIINPKPLGDAHSMIQSVRGWLSRLPADGSTNLAIFEEKWRLLTSDDIAILSALIAEGGNGVKESSVFLRLVRQHSIDRDIADKILRERLPVLVNVNFVQRRHNIYDGDEVSLHANWASLMRHEIAKLATPHPGGA
jgi:hypothetical protein